MNIKAPLVLLLIKPQNRSMFELANKRDRPFILSLDVTLALEITRTGDQKNR
jgi:hypothetical protein